MNRRKMLIVAFVVLCVATVSVVACSILAASAQSRYGEFYRLELLAEAPQDYSVLTDPDPWLLQAINSPGTWVRVENQYESSFHLQPALELTFEYNGSFYLAEIVYVDPLPIEVPLRVAQVGIAGAWIAFGTMALVDRKRLFSQRQAPIQIALAIWICARFHRLLVPYCSVI
jgi:hypothetical protein